MRPSSKSNRRVWIPVIKCGLVVMVVALGSASVLGWQSDRKWSIRRVHYRINPNNGDVSNAAAIADNKWGADQWTQQSEAGFRFVYDGTSSISVADYADGVNVVMFRNEYKPGSNTARATTYTYYDPANPGVILGFDMVYWEKAATFITMSTP